MRGIASFIMRGRWSALLVVVAASVVPFLTWAAGAVLALVTLRRGVAEGLLVSVIAFAAIAVVYALSGFPVELALRPALELWLPVVAVSFWLRRTVSLAATVRFAAGLAMLAVAGFYLVVADPEAFWRQAMEVAGSALAGAGPAEQQGFATMIERLLPAMTGLLAVTLLGLVLASILLGRAMQAALYNPGGFRAEFHALDLGRGYAAVVALLFLASAVAGAGMFYDLALVAGSVFVLQLLALAHAVVASRGWSGGWLVLVYILVPLAFQAVMIAGIADAVFNWRKRLGGPGADKA